MRCAASHLSAWLREFDTIIAQVDEHLTQPEGVAQRELAAEAFVHVHLRRG